MDPNKIDKYLYIRKTPTWLIRCIYSLGLLTWSGVIFGYSKFYATNPTFFYFIAPFIGFLVLYHVVSFGIILCYKQFDLKAHFQLLKSFNLKILSKNGRSLPTVDIFLPICGEDSYVVENTFKAVSNLNYPKYTVYVLDDKGNSEHKSFARGYGFRYMSRNNKGEMKKAGNLKHGFERSEGEFIVVYDADFAPHPDFLTELLPYMKDPKVAIVQSPQYFQTDDEVYKISALQYGAAHVQEDFYRFIQVARSRLGAPICCGSNAIYRRSALDTIGGTVQIEHSEDAYTGFELSNQGYRVLFVPLILAIGLCPDNLHSYFHQQHRWCSGSLSMMLSLRFWNSRLSIIQKICYSSGFMYYLSHLVTLVFSFQVFIVLFLYHSTFNFYNALPFIPCMLFSFIIIQNLRITKMRFGGFLARNAYIYSYSHATIVAFLRKTANWQPTNTKRVDVSKEYLQQLHAVAIYFFVYMVIFAFSIGYGSIDIFNVKTYSLLFWIFYNIISTAIILVYLYLLLDSLKQKKEGIDNLRSWLLRWRLKTGGAYGALLLVCVSTASVVGLKFDVAGNQLPILTASAIEPYVEERFQTSDISGTYTQLVENSVQPEEAVATSTSELMRSVYLFKEDRSFGEMAEDIKLLQQFLNLNGFILTQNESGAPGFETTYFGPLTKLALRHYQINYGLLVTGILDSDTRNHINSTQLQ